MTDLRSFWVFFVDKCKLFLWRALFPVDVLRLLFGLLDISHNLHEA